MRTVALFFLLGSASVVAQTAVDSTLGDVTVTAARDRSAEDAPTRVSTLSRRALEATAAARLADALAARAPVHVRRYGPSGLASVTIRGAAASQTLVLLDGQRLTDPALGQVDLGLLPAALLESVEVLSGPAAGLYGSDAVGGVIGLRTPAPGTRRLTLEAGPWGERRASGIASGRQGRLRAMAAAELSRSTDDYSFRDVTRLDAPRVARAGWDSRQATAYAALAFDARQTTAGLSLWAADAERGLGGTDAIGARQWDRRLRVGATAGHPVGRLRLDVLGHVQTTRLRYAAPFPSDRADALDDTGETVSSAVDLRASAPVGGGAWTASLTGGTGRATHPSLPDAATDRVAGLALAGRQPAGPVTLFPALRADLYRPAGGPRRASIAPQLGLSLDLGADWRIKASAARAFRMPTLNDRYWQPGGNPALRPETAWSAETGLAWTGSAHRAEVTGFGATARDQIVWAPTAAGFWAPSNVARTRSLGLEASAQGTRALRLAGRAGRGSAGALVTLTDARDLDLGQPLRYVPRWSLKAWGGLERNRVRLDVGARWVGARYTTASASLPLSAYLVLDGHLSARQTLGGLDLALGLAAENLTGLQYEIIRSYPMPPRHARLRLTLTPR